MRSSHDRELAAAYDHSNALTAKVRSLTEVITAQLATIAEQQAEIARLNARIQEPKIGQP